MGIEGRLRRLERSLDDEVGPPPQGYYDARARRTRCTKALLASALGQDLAEDDLDFVERYRDSALKDSDRELVERYTPPRSPEDAAKVRAKMKESLDAIAEKRRAHGL